MACWQRWLCQVFLAPAGRLNLAPPNRRTASKVLRVSFVPLSDILLPSKWNTWCWDYCEPSSLVSGSLLLYMVPHRSRSATRGARVLPSSLGEYSTLGGTCG